ncbi:unnamed protein product [Boreogadus saida]
MAISYGESEQLFGLRLSSGCDGFTSLRRVGRGGQRLSSTAGAVGRRLGKCHYVNTTTTTNRTSSGNPFLSFLSNFIPTPGNEAEEK